MALASHGSEGIRMFLEGKFDVVVADYQMPGLDGVGLFRRIREECSDGDRPRMIMVTGRLEGDGLDQSGIDCLLRKPFDIDAIVRAVEGAGISPGRPAPTKRA